MDVLRAGMEMKRQILSGALGPSGTRFPSVRDWSQRLGCSSMTAMKAAEWVRRERLTLAYGKHTYLTIGRAQADSELEQRLRAGRHSCFGILCRSLDNAYTATVIDMLSVALREAGYRAAVFVSDADRERELEDLYMLPEMGMAGAFFFPHYRFKNRQAFERFPLPLVALGRQIADFRRSTVTVNNPAVGRLAAEHLLKGGCDRCLYVGFHQEWPMVDQRLQGFREELARRGAILSNADVVLVKNGDVDAAMAQLALRLQEGQERMGVFCYHDLLASETLKLCRHFRLDVPKQVGIIGCDDLAITQSTTPTLSTIHYPYRRLSVMAVKAALEELQSCICRSQALEAFPRVIARQSTACIISADIGGGIAER